MALQRRLKILKNNLIHCFFLIVHQHFWMFSVFIPLLAAYRLHIHLLARADSVFWTRTPSESLSFHSFLFFMSFIFTKLEPPSLQMQGSITSIMFGLFIYLFIFVYTVCLWLHGALGSFCFSVYLFFFFLLLLPPFFVICLTKIIPRGRRWSFLIGINVWLEPGRGVVWFGLPVSVRCGSGFKWVFVKLCPSVCLPVCDIHF